MDRMKTSKTFLKVASILLVGFSLTACSSVAERLQRVGQEPDFKPVEAQQEAEKLNYVSMPMPNPQFPEVQQANSLWQSNRKGFFKDQRASEVGDILTVNIDINDIAEITNETTRTRNSSEDASASALLGFETYLDDVLPNPVDPTNLASTNSTSNSAGTGEVKRDESIRTKMAAVIAQKLPNGNFVITGHQEVRVNFEVRELRVAGVVRPEDISPQNAIDYSQIAEARIAYGGRGQIMDVQQPRYGQQVFDILYPF